MFVVVCTAYVITQSEQTKYVGWNHQVGVPILQVRTMTHPCADTTSGHARGTCGIEEESSTSCPHNNNNNNMFYINSEAEIFFVEALFQIGKIYFVHDQVTQMFHPFRLTVDLYLIFICSYSLGQF